jgi:hypothetical protein
LADEGERLLGNDTERLPTCGGVSVPLHGSLKVAVGLGEGGVHDGEGVLVVGGAGLVLGLPESGVRHCSISL